MNNAMAKKVYDNIWAKLPSLITRIRFHPVGKAAWRALFVGIAYIATAAVNMQLGGPLGTQWQVVIAAGLEKAFHDFKESGALSNLPALGLFMR